ncbi:MAG TPA: hypothetical protein VE441_02780 [Mycobacterium sp.]|nr:hypothetical protein [Mycobacterium sp.]
MRSKIWGVLLTSGVMLAPTAVSVAPAMADTPGCVTKAEFHSVAKGWSMTRVHNRFDTAGRQSWFFGATAYSAAEQGREYRACHHPTYSIIEVDYKKKSGTWRVTSKSAYWG